MSISMTTDQLKVVSDSLCTYNEHSVQFGIYAPSFLNICHEQIEVFEVLHLYLMNHQVD